MPEPSEVAGQFYRWETGPHGAHGVLKYDVAMNRLAVSEDSGTTWSQFVGEGAVVNLTDAATIAVDASLGKIFRVTLGGNRTLGVPTNPEDGYEISFELVQDGTGTRTLALASGAGGYVLPAAIANTTLSTAAASLDIIKCRFNLAKNRWLVTEFIKGFA